MMIGGHITIAGSQGGFDFSAGGRQAHVASLLLAMISGWPETIRFRRDDGIDGHSISGLSMATGNLDEWGEHHQA